MDPGSAIGVRGPLFLLSRSRRGGSGGIGPGITVSEPLPGRRKARHPEGGRS